MPEIVETYVGQASTLSGGDSTARRRPYINLHHLYITEDANPCNTLQAGEEETA